MTHDSHIGNLIREGSKLSPQRYGTFVSSFDGGTCALGALLRSLGYSGEEIMASVEVNWVGYLKRVFPVLAKREHCPATDHTIEEGIQFYASRVDLVIHLNDMHRWKREEIALWLDVVESADVRQPVTEPQPIEQPIMEEVR